MSTIKDFKVLNLAVLMTCHNRKDKSLACLKSLMAQQEVVGLKRQIFLVDDGSDDFTGDAVNRLFPEVHVLRGDGSLYWCGGMRVAFEAALKLGFDYYLFLNDDVLLFPDALERVIGASLFLNKSKGEDGIIAGSMRDGKSKELTYGGMQRKSHLNSLEFSFVSPGQTLQPIDVANGNFLLIPKSASEVLGNLSKDYTHGMGDFDYCLRAKAAGISVWVAPGFVGECSRNSITETCRDRSLPLRERLEKMSKPTGLPPAREWLSFTRRHGGFVWPFYWLRTFLRILCPSLWVVLRSRQS